jgi:hypothetical protein
MGARPTSTSCCSRSRVRCSRGILGRGCRDERL